MAYSLLFLGVLAQSVSHFHRKNYWKLDNPDANPYLYVHDLPKTSVDNIPPNTVSATPPWAPRTWVPHFALPSSTFSIVLVTFFFLAFWSAISIDLYASYKYGQAPRISKGHASIPAGYQIVSKAQLDTIYDENIEAKEKIQHALGSVKGYGQLATLWETAFNDLKDRFLEYVQQSRRSDWDSEAQILELAVEAIESLDKLSEEWKKSSRDMKGEYETACKEGAEKVGELEHAMVVQEEMYEKLVGELRSKRESKSARRRKGVDAAAAEASSA